MVNGRNSPRRRRYTIAHELGHFLNERHRPTVDFGFACTPDDLSHPRRGGVHQRQELEANAFAIEVLAPLTALRVSPTSPAELEHAIAIADIFDISREAAVRRYIALHDECVAAVFSRNGRIRYIEKGAGFPATTVWSGDSLGDLLADRPSGTLTQLNAIAAPRWLKWPEKLCLFAQTLHQVMASP